jgi:hypothetical protein
MAAPGSRESRAATEVERDEETKTTSLWTDSGIGAGGDRGADFRVDKGGVEPIAVEPVPQAQLKLVNPFAQPVPRKAKKARSETGSTRKKRVNVEPDAPVANPRDMNGLHPPSIPAHKWKPSGLTGWELYTRRPAISANGKRSSSHKYIAYYSRKDVRRLHDAREKTANARRA